MKNLVFVLLLSLAFISCTSGNKAVENVVNDSTIVAVDTIPVDTLSVDSVL